MINPILETCIECDGDGKTFYSCCGDDVKGTEYEDYDIYPTCKEHLGGPEECESCKGTGKVERLACTSFEFNGKYADYLEAGHYGLDLDHIPAIEYLDQQFQEFVKIPGFKYTQIKSKFQSFRFYCDGPSREKITEVENKLKEIYDQFINKPVLPINSSLHDE